MERTNIIFLDIDGVLVTGKHLTDSNGAWADTFGHEFDPKTVHELNTLIKTTNAKIVISSTWRIIHGMLKGMQWMWKEREMPGEVIGVTPDVDGGRGEQIRQWLLDNRAVWRVDKWVVIDDDEHDIPFKDKLVKTSFEHGLTRDRTHDVIRILEGRVN